MNAKSIDQLEAYLVGGAVRDELLGRPVNDRDWVVVGATVKLMKRLGFKQVGYNHSRPFCLSMTYWGD